MAARKTKASPKKATAKKPAKRGRPSLFSKQLAEKICSMLASSDKSLVTICKQKGMPGYNTVLAWLARNEEFQGNYARAREAQGDYLAAQIVAIADKCRTGTKTRETKDGTFKETGDMVERSRLQIDARKWYAGKLAPKKYGDKVALVGGDGEKDEPICFTLRKIEGKK